MTNALVKHWRDYASIAPFFVLFAAFGVVPLLYALYLSTLQWDGISDPEFVGLDQWARLFDTPDVVTAAGNTVIIFLLGQIPVAIGALIAAAMLSQPRLRFRGFYQTAFFLPQVTSVVAVTIVFQSLFAEKYGFVNNILDMLGLPAQQWLSEPWKMKVVIALMVIWRGFGYFLLLFMAGIAAIDRSLVEAAQIDGANPVRIFRSITLPMLTPTLVFVTLTGAIAGMQIFTEPQVLFNFTGNPGGPNNGGLTMMLLQYEYLGGIGSTGTIQLVKPDLGFAAVIGWVIFIALVLLALINNRFLRKSLGGR
ncbi:carbohydrate ABC transporter permease [Streptomyces sp. NPDC093094]|uniref:carbohydrate ABC transporter permease n=1 Tax=Streptomyces sp. NPDC093094 TaxID=3366026 RepID=UPI0038282091